MKTSRFIWAFVLLLLGLTACTTNQSNSALAELLEKGKPTLLFFYTEN